MEAMLGISLYSYLYLNPAKIVCLSYYLCFSLAKLEKRAEQVLTGSNGGGGERDGLGGRRERSPPKMYAHMNK
jgi:hypothetical protein